MTSDRRQGGRQRLGIWVAAVTVAGTIPLAVLNPAGDSRVMGSTQVSVAFFATILTGEAVIFALSFSASSAWPSLKEIDAHIAFRAWVVIGWLGAMLLGVGLLTGVHTLSTLGAVLFLLADALGIFSFARLFGLASSGGRKRLLSKALERRLADRHEPIAAVSRRVATDDLLSAYLRELDAAVVANDGNGVRDRVEELTALPSAFAGAHGRAGLHLEVLHRLAKAALAGRLDSTVAAASAQRLVDSLLVQIDTARGQDRAGALTRDEAAALAGHLGRYLAWLAGTAWIMSTRHVTAPAAARDLVAFSVRARDTITFTLDPDPPFADTDTALGTAVDSPLGVLAWIRQFVEFHGSAQANAFYPAFELLTGTKFRGNYWDGASILTELRAALFGSEEARVDSPQADRARDAFVNVEEFDRTWTLVSVGALTTLRNTSVPHPAALVRPEFTPDRRLLAAYVRTYASHRYVSTADEARIALMRLMGRGEHPTSLWSRSSALLGSCSYPVPVPLIEPRQRIAGCVLAIACRLAPLRPEDGAGQLRLFLERLPEDVIAVVHQLAARTLPIPDDQPSSAGPVEEIIRRLGIIQWADPVATAGAA
ncbi:hypothetical protein [Streptomyces fuscigenes]|uniref:hypothetical protein n=1 Tax=Streptomyces fuscigenes TaxID=1528880 RepID=UPI001F373884|nr:hypothetical protein [Streptomyces fuscigenes]MCF3960424.1 hypothetical protein [Streptomyces fuscigenes]